jgi:creatinine amidohydrolase
MAPVRYAEMTWEEARACGEPAVAILPLGAVEAHGPHLPLSTDALIAEAMAESAAALLERNGTTVLILPTLSYTTAPFAIEFPGTLSVRPEIVTELVFDLGVALRSGGVTRLAIANAHLDPAHLDSIHRAVERLRTEGLRIAFPDLTRKPWALRLTEEFRSGACHAGRFESSIVLATRPDLVRSEIQAQLEPNPASLSVAIRGGKRSFRDAGGPRAYFGAPAEATASEGAESIATLGEILYDAICETAVAAGAPS